MKKLICVMSILAIIVAVLTAGVSAAPVKTKAPSVEAKAEITLTAVAPKEEKILESRFLSMLNRNFVYGKDFDSIEAIVNNSVIALLDLRDSEDEAYIAETYVADYILDMYGIEDVEFDDLNPEFAAKEGFVYILPRGYSLYKHSCAEVKQNEDGSFTVKTMVKISDHDGVFAEGVCTTLFVENEASAFGYSIITSELEVAENLI